MAAGPRGQRIGIKAQPFQDGAILAGPQAAKRLSDLVSRESMDRFNALFSESRQRQQLDAAILVAGLHLEVAGRRKFAQHSADA
ncbi:hypothetical protein CHELA1G11_13418 [Hyphomicrobiales bacterium]|nr:hypothetical protein CHELA1G2_10901 [Hyphomicrobiales bacterium]CAH1671531.1 hypothetical protein CHELA1G11_13418 [Hyphomicrobiales bacterium]